MLEDEGRCFGNVSAPGHPFNRSLAGRAAGRAGRLSVFPRLLTAISPRQQFLAGPGIAVLDRFKEAGDVTHPRARGMELFFFPARAG